MFPFNPFFPLLGFMFPYRRRLNTLMGIPVLKTTGVSSSTTSVNYTVNEYEYRALPREGVFFLEVRQSSPTVSADLPIAVYENGETTSSSVMLKNGQQENVPASDLVQYGRYLIYYNKNTNSFQLVNSYTTTATA